MKTTTIQRLIVALTAVCGAAVIYAQNPVSISQVGTTAVTTTVPVSGTVTANAGTGTLAVSGPLTDTQLRATAVPVSGTVTANAGTGTMAVSLASVPSHAVTNAGTFATQAAQSGTWTVQPGNTANTTAWKVDGSAVTQPVSAVSLPLHESQPVATATTTNGTATCFLSSAASTNSTNCKSSAGNLYAVHVTNTTTTNYYVRLYNASSAPTCSSATGFVETIPALGASANGGVNGRVNVVPQAFSTGIGFCVTGGGSSTDNTSAATGVFLTLEYK